MKPHVDTTSFKLDLDVKSAVPIYEQIKNAVKLAIFSKKLVDGDKIISIRDLSAQYSVNPLTIMKAYNYLEIEGFLYSRKGTGYFVQIDKGKLHKERKEFFQGKVSEFLETIAGLGYTIDDIREELKRITK